MGKCAAPRTGSLTDAHILHSVAIETGKPREEGVAGYVPDHPCAVPTTFLRARPQVTRTRRCRTQTSRPRRWSTSLIFFHVHVCLLVARLSLLPGEIGPLRRSAAPERLLCDFCVAF